MAKNRMRLHDRDLLAQLVSRTSYRALASKAHCSPAIIGYLVTGKRDGCGRELAESIADGLGVRTHLLFVPDAATRGGRNSDGVAA